MAEILPFPFDPSSLNIKKTSSSDVLPAAEKITDMVQAFVADRDSKGPLQNLIINRNRSIQERRALFSESLTAMLEAVENGTIGENVFDERILAILEADGAFDMDGNRNYAGVLDVITRWHTSEKDEEVIRAERLCEHISVTTMKDKLGFCDAEWCDTNRFVAYINIATNAINYGDLVDQEGTIINGTSLLEQLMGVVLERYDEGDDDLPNDIFLHIKARKDADRILETIVDNAGRNSQDVLEFNGIDIDAPDWEQFSSDI